MPNRDVIKISFDSESGVKDLEKSLLDSMSNISDKASAKLAEAFLNAGKNKKLKKQLTGVYQDLFDELMGSDNNTKEIDQAIDRFAGKIEYLQQVINKTRNIKGKKKNEGLLDGLAIEDIDKVLEGYELVTEAQEKINKYKHKDFHEQKRSETTIKSLKELEEKYGDVSKAKGDYEKKVTSHLKNANIETSIISKEIKEYSSLIALFEKINTTKVDVGSEDAIKKSQALLYVMQQINDLEKGFAPFSNFRLNELDSKSLKSSITELSQGVNASISKFVDTMSKELEATISKTLITAVESAEKASQRQFKSAQKTQAKMGIVDNTKNGKADPNDANDYDYDEHNNIFAKYFDTANKSAEDLEDTFYDIGDKLESLNKKHLDGDLVGEGLKEYIALYKQLEHLTTKIDGFSVPKKYTEQFNALLNDKNLLEYSNRLDEIQNKGFISNNSSNGLNGNIDNSKVEELSKEIAEVKEDISSLKGRVDTLEDTTAFDNLSSQVAEFNEKINNVDGSIENLVNSFKLLSELSLTDLQKVAIPFFNGINQVYVENNGNKISGYWDELKKGVEGSNSELRELLKLVGLYDSKTNSLKLISDGMENSGGLIGDTKVLIARKNKRNQFDEKTILKNKLDEAYKAGVNVARILDIIGTKESKVFFDIQEKATGNILGNIYGQNDEDFVNTEWLDASEEQIKKLISDMLTLQKMGVNVESNLTNIMYDKKKGFSFIDLDLSVTEFENDAELMEDHIIRIFGDLEDFYLDKNDSANASIIAKAREHFENLSEQVINSYAETQDSHSPSKEFEKLENDAVDGIVEGANKNEDRLKNVGRQKAENVKDGFKEGMAEVGATALFDTDKTEVLSGTDAQADAHRDNAQAIEKEVNATEQLIKAIKDLSEANEKSARRPEQAFSANIDTGYVSPVITSEYGNSVNIGQAVKNATSAVNATFHSHPEDIAALSPADVRNAFARLSENILYSFVVGMEEVAVFDASKVKTEDQDKILKLFTENLYKKTEELQTVVFNQFLSQWDSLEVGGKIKTSEDSSISDPLLKCCNEAIRKVFESYHIDDKVPTEVKEQIESKLKQSILSTVNNIDGNSKINHSDIVNPIFEELKATLPNLIQFNDPEKFTAFMKHLEEKLYHNLQGLFASVLSKSDSAFLNKKQLMVRETLESALSSVGYNSKDVYRTSSINDYLSSGKLLIGNQTPLSSDSSAIIEENKEVIKSNEEVIASEEKVKKYRVANRADIPKLKSNVEPIKDTFDETEEVSKMDKVATATDEAMQAKKDFATANEGVQDSVDGSKSKLQLEAELMESIAKNARDAAKAKKDFVNANKEVKASADSSSDSLDKESKSMDKVNEATTKNNAKTKDIENMTSNAKTSPITNRLINLGKGNKKDTSEYDKLIKTIKDVISLQGEYSEEIDGTKASIDRLKNASKEYAKALYKDFEGNKGSLVNSFRTTVANITNDKRFNEDDLKVVNDLNPKIKELEDFKLNNVDDVEKFVQLISQIGIEIKKVKAIPKEDLLPDASELNKDLANINRTLAGGYKIPKQLKQEFNELQKAYENAFDSNGNVKITNKELQNLRDTLSKLNAEFEATGKKKSLFGSFGQRLTDMNTKFLAQYFSFQDFIRYVRQGFETIKEYDAALTEMNKVSDKSIQTLKEFQKESFELANAIGTTASQIQASTADFLRLGESFEQAKQSALDANALFKVSEFTSIEEATEALVAMSQAYSELEKSEINDILNYTGNNFSISTSELASALQRSAATLKVAGNDIYEATALITAGNAILQDAESVGTGLKMISLRILGTEEAKNELASLGEDVDDFVVQTKSKLDETVRNYTAVASNGFKGISVLDDNGNYKSTYEILRDISQVYQEILEADKKAGTNRGQALLEVLAGKNRSNVAASILNSPELLTSVYEEALTESQGSVQKELDSQLASIESHLNALKNAWDDIWVSESNREIINFFIDLAKGILDTVNELGGLKALLIGGTSFLTVKSFKSEGRIKKFILINMPSGSLTVMCTSYI